MTRGQPALLGRSAAAGDTARLTPGPLDERAIEVLEALPDEIAVLDDDGGVVWLAARTATRFGRRPVDVIGRPLAEFIHPADQPLVEHALRMVVAEPTRSLPFPVRLLRRDGSWSATELIASIADVEEPDGGHRVALFVAFRQGATAVQTQAVLQLMAAGAAFPTIADALVRLASAEPMGWRAALIVETPHGRTIFAGSLPPHLFARSDIDDANRMEAPWDLALVHGEGLTLSDLDALAPEVAHRAAQLGFIGCVTLAVRDHDQQRAALVVWFDSGATTTILPLWLEHEVEPLLQLALEQHLVRARLEWAARFDALTGLPNRGHLLDEVSRTLARCRRGMHAALFYLDLDGFKSVNDRHGHLAGDEVLVSAAHRLRNEIRPGDIIGRLGGDEFVLVCPGCPSLTEVEAIADRLIGSMRGAVTLAGGAQVQVGVSVGAVLVGELRTTVEDALAAADANLYRAKAAGRGRVIASAVV